MHRALTTEEIKLVAEAERLMDDGKIPFVMLDGQRASVPVETMTELGLRQGQTINAIIFVEILKQNIALCQTKIALAKAATPAE